MVNCNKYISAIKKIRFATKDPFLYQETSAADKLAINNMTITGLGKYYLDKKSPEECGFAIPKYTEYYLVKKLPEESGFAILK